MLHAACCMLHGACCLLHVACCMLHVACRGLAWAHRGELCVFDGVKKNIGPNRVRPLFPIIILIKYILIFCFWISDFWLFRFARFFYFFEWLHFFKLSTFVLRMIASLLDFWFNCQVLLFRFVRFCFISLNDCQPLRHVNFLQHVSHVYLSTRWLVPNSNSSKYSSKKRI